MFPFQKKTRRWPYIFAGLCVIAVALAGYAYLWAARLIGPVQTAIAPRPIAARPLAPPTNVIGLLRSALGFGTPRTYLLLFQNNTELRPGGGFLGAYAVVKVQDANVVTLKVDGTEILDKQTPSDWKPVPPQPIRKYLGMERWYFRDSNWSPDFFENVQKAVAFYVGERGELASEVDTVVAITPTVLEELLRLVGPIQLRGLTFTADNVTETLEREVEYSFRDHGIAWQDRKDILRPLMQELVARVRRDAVFHPDRYLTLLRDLAAQKQFLAFSRSADLQAYFTANQWTGDVVNAPGDYLLWVDANLGALKTDHALVRHLNYELSPSGPNQWTGAARMTYVHEGSFDWRTTRYRSYTRVYVPIGSVLQSVTAAGKNNVVLPVNEADQGQELGKQWFGAFISVEPKETKTVEFLYTLPPAIGTMIHHGAYQLIIQKQAGTIAHGLTVNANFATPVTAATPPELPSEWHDNRYHLETDLRVDREFSVSLKQ